MIEHSFVWILATVIYAIMPLAFLIYGVQYVGKFYLTTTKLGKVIY